MPKPQTVKVRPRVDYLTVHKARLENDSRYKAGCQELLKLLRKEIHKAGTLGDEYKHLTYTEVIAKLPRNPLNLDRRAKLPALLADISRDDENKLICAMVIAKKRKRPGPGFFRLLAETTGRAIPSEAETAEWKKVTQALIARLARSRRA